MSSQVYQSYQDHLYPQPLHLSGRSSRATSQTRTALASIYMNKVFGVNNSIHGSTR